MVGARGFFPVIRSFGDKQTEMIFQGERSRTLPPDIQSRANMKLFRIDQATQLEQLALPPSNRLETLAGNLKGFWSIRINQQWRIVFRWNAGDAFDVKITDYH
jgi:toxin HigB-1